MVPSGKKKVASREEKKFSPLPQKWIVNIICRLYVVEGHLSPWIHRMLRCAPFLSRRPCFQINLFRCWAEKQCAAKKNNYFPWVAYTLVRSTLFLFQILVGSEVVVQYYGDSECLFQPSWRNKIWEPGENLLMCQLCATCLQDHSGRHCVHMCVHTQKHIHLNIHVASES